MIGSSVCLRTVAYVETPKSSWKGVAGVEARTAGRAARGEKEAGRLDGDVTNFARVHVTPVSAQEHSIVTLCMPDDKK